MLITQLPNYLLTQLPNHRPLNQFLDFQRHPFPRIPHQRMRTLFTSRNTGISARCPTGAFQCHNMIRIQQHNITCTSVGNHLLKIAWVNRFVDRDQSTGLLQGNNLAVISIRKCDSIDSSFPSDSKWNIFETIRHIGINSLASRCSPVPTPM